MELAVLSDYHELRSLHDMSALKWGNRQHLADHSTARSAHQVILFEHLPERIPLCPSMNLSTAQVDRLVEFLGLRQHASSDTLSSFEQGRSKAGLGEGKGSGETRESRADDDTVHLSHHNVEGEDSSV